ncbi:related to cycloheximide-inducible protein CIP70 (cytochrome P450 family) [Phialocephala subalpina]|uniref:Related to cycloheximide-inducible protein CIP70 (Cytochrome P450 family) n=1 Tax=Phialocephala subalpina TaxID=576137 RepID=A0A1L7WU13_9HELO|nr:related to cycloheximide-inducible protein CIP70 (cytochrome P450 family) [Phialocephala subalpina]
MLFSVALVSACLAILLLVATVQYVYSRFFSRQSIPDSIPWVSQSNSPLARARITLQSFLHTRDLVLEGYHKYSKKNTPFVLPNITTGPEVILPMSQMEWLLSQPDNVISQNEVNRAFLQADHTMLHPKVIPDHVHDDVIKKELTKLLGDYMGDVQEEIDFAFRREWGVDTKEWKEVGAYESMLNVVARVSNRVLVGFPLCRNEEYLENSKNFARLVVVQAVFISFIPESFKRFFAPLINIFDYKRYLACAKYSIPIIKQRLSTPSPDEKVKNDYIQWSISHSYRNNNPSERTVDIISKRLNVIQFAAIQSSAITLTNLILDLAACPLLPQYLSHMRAEILSELNASDGIWTKGALARMLSLDSCLRESMRLWGFVSRGLLKKVVAKEGVRLPSGEHLVCGTNVGFHAFPVHRDEHVYECSQEFRPLRFVSGQGDQKQGTALVTTSSTFMAFSHGRHACPGRFFASQQMKLILAYIALNYDIERIPVRPDNQWLVGSQGPPLDFKVRVRRRVDI